MSEFQVENASCRNKKIGLKTETTSSLHLVQHITSSAPTISFGVLRAAILCDYICRLKNITLERCVRFAVPQQQPNETSHLRACGRKINSELHSSFECRFGSSLCNQNHTEVLSDPSHGGRLRQCSDFLKSITQTADGSGDMLK
eukprot:TRINITY_DN9625_c0_g1_i2.p1 TRINITY_DN9625_c0_g1~~TRINITY_DN9625_c0_g1_i2.p1  ORF type:complete len:144 (-),score=1.77 TRINITY_DN9625_c0_g1_i2:70-501(-)